MHGQCVCVPLAQRLNVQASLLLMMLWSSVSKLLCQVHFVSTCSIRKSACRLQCTCRRCYSAYCLPTNYNYDKLADRRIDVLSRFDTARMSSVLMPIRPVRVNVKWARYLRMSWIRSAIFLVSWRCWWAGDADHSSDALKHYRKHDQSTDRNCPTVRTAVPSW